MVEASSLSRRNTFRPDGSATSMSGCPSPQRGQSRPPLQVRRHIGQIFSMGAGCSRGPRRGSTQIATRTLRGLGSRPSHGCRELRLLLRPGQPVQLSRLHAAARDFRAHRRKAAPVPDHTGRSAHGDGERAMKALFHAYWGEGDDISDPAVVERVLRDAELDGKRLLAMAAEQEVKDELRKNTDLALARGVFGVPTIFVGERSFWGNDRLEFVESALRQARLSR